MQIDWGKTSELIQRQIEKDEDFLSESGKDILDRLSTNLSHQRSMITHIAIVGGALASFSLLILNSSWVYCKTFLILAIVILLGVIGWSFYSLNTILDYENRELTKLSNQYPDMISKRIKARIQVLEDKNVKKYVEALEKINMELISIRKEEAESEKKWKFKFDWDRSKKILIYAFLFALFFIGLSFIRL
ncbi:MAG: hypothetical protein ACE5IT_03470 [bacterium]